MPSNYLQGLSARPTQVTVHEQLAYRVQIGDRTDTSLLSAKGTIHIQVPYDRRENFNLDDAIRLIQSVGDSQEIPNALIGYLQLSKCEKTSFSARDSSAIAPSLGVPIAIPIRDAYTLASIGARCATSLNYEITDPPESPVMVDAVLVDESQAKTWDRISTSFQERLELRIGIQSDVGNITPTIHAALLKRIEEAKQEAQKELDEIKKKMAQAEAKPAQELVQESTSLSEIANRLSKILARLKELDDSHGKLTAEAVDQVFAEAIGTDFRKLAEEHRRQIEKLKDFVHHNLGGIRIAYLGIDWPCSEQTLEGSRWIYNPETRRVEVRDLDSRWNDDKQLYESLLALEMYRPVDRFATLRGRLIMETDKLLSGIQATWLTPMLVQDDQLAVKYKTSIILDIEEIALPQIFQRREFYPNRHLVFRGVLPTPERLRDAENALNDSGLTIIGRSYGADLEHADLAKGCLITAIPQSVGKPMGVWVRLSGDTKSGTHTIHYDAGQQELKASVPVGDLHVGLYTRAVGNSQSVNALLNNIETLLESRFAALKILQP